MADEQRADRLLASERVAAHLDSGDEKLGIHGRDAEGKLSDAAGKLDELGAARDIDVCGSCRHHSMQSVGRASFEKQTRRRLQFDA
jgi:hypothetical protein